MPVMPLRPLRGAGFSSAAQRSDGKAGGCREASLRSRRGGPRRERAAPGWRRRSRRTVACPSAQLSSPIGAGRPPTETHSNPDDRLPATWRSRAFCRTAARRARGKLVWPIRHPLALLVDMSSDQRLGECHRARGGEQAIGQRCVYKVHESFQIRLSLRIASSRVYRAPQLAAASVGVPLAPVTQALQSVCSGSTETISPTATADAISESARRK